MLRAPVESVLHAMSAELLTGTPSAVLAGVAIDSRAIEPCNAFFALPGERADGHEFLSDAIDAGACALVVTRSAAELGDVLERAFSAGVAVLRVDDCVRALQALASWHRSRLDAVVVGITGSSGKTSTKDLLAAVLGTTLKVVSTSGNRNNELGVPLTLLAADVDAEVVIVEMAMRGLGQIAELCGIARPTVGLITNVGQTHVEVVGSEDAIAAAKGELVRAVPAHGRVFLNGDDARTSQLAAASSAPVTLYGLSSGCDVRAEDIELDDWSVPSFTLVADGSSQRITLAVPGRHNVYNALAAASVALHLGVTPARLAEGLGEARLSDMRMQRFTTASGVSVINDAYNANPASMRAALETLAAISTEGRRIAVLGDMAELGSYADVAHFHTGGVAADLGIDVVVAVGERSKRIAEGYVGTVHSRRESSRHFDDVEAAADALPGIVRPGDVVLVKASRVMGLERVVDRLVSADA